MGRLIIQDIDQYQALGQNVWLQKVTQYYRQYFLEERGVEEAIIKKGGAFKDGILVQMWSWWSMEAYPKQTSWIVYHVLRVKD